MKEKPNEYIDHILKWENKDIILSKIHRQCFKDNSFPPDSEFQLEMLPDTKEQCYIFTWDVGMPPPDMEIDIVIDRNSPEDIAAKFPKKRHLHRHDFFEILYVYSGQCTSTVSGIKKTLKKGDICLYNLQVAHKVELPDPDSVIINIMIRQDLFQQSFLDLLAENDMITDFFIQSIYQIDNRARQLILHPSRDFNCVILVQHMVEVYFQNQTMSQSILKALLILLLAEMARQYQCDITSETETDSSKMSLVQVITYIDQHYENISLDSLAEHFCYTPRSMTRYIKSNTGMTFKELVQQLRLQQACRMLRSSGQGIHDISYRIGYTERASFDKAFKAKYHITPVEYRNMYRKK